jgi:hypothetical protein
MAVLLVDRTSGHGQHSIVPPFNHPPFTTSGHREDRPIPSLVSGSDHHSTREMDLEQLVMGQPWVQLIGSTDGSTSTSDIFYGWYIMDGTWVSKWCLPSKFGQSPKKGIDMICVWYLDPLVWFPKILFLCPTAKKIHSGAKSEFVLELERWKLSSYPSNGQLQSMQTSVLTTLKHRFSPQRCSTKRGKWISDQAWWLPSGNLTLVKIAIEIVDSPNKKWWIFP